MFRKGELKFLVEIIICQFLLMIYYRMFMFKPIFDLSYDESVRFFNILVCVFGVVTGILSDYKKELLDAFVCTALPLEIYTVLIYLPYNNPAVIAVLICMFLVLFIYAFLLFKQKIRNKDMAFSVIAYRIKKYINCSRIISFLFLMIIVSPVMYNTINNIPITKSHSDNHGLIKEVENLYDVNFDNFAKLEENEWSTLSIDEKKEVL